jgi:hypothetical protein
METFRTYYLCFIGPSPFFMLIYMDDVTWKHLELTISVLSVLLHLYGLCYMETFRTYNLCFIGPSPFFMLIYMYMDDVTRKHLEFTISVLLVLLHF